MQLTPHQPITIPSINLQPRTSTFDWYVYRGQVKVARLMGQKGLPTTLFFNAAGRLVDVRVGEFSYPTLNQRINALKLGHEAGGKT